MHPYSAIEFLCGDNGMAYLAPDLYVTNSIRFLLPPPAISFRGNFLCRVSDFRVMCSSIEFLLGKHGTAPEFVCEEGPIVVAASFHSILLGSLV